MVECQTIPTYYIRKLHKHNRYVIVNVLCNNCRLDIVKSGGKGRYEKPRFQILFSTLIYQDYYTQSQKYGQQSDNMILMNV